MDMRPNLLKRPADLGLRDFHGLAHEEVAAVVGAKIAAVRKRYSRALQELRHTVHAEHLEQRQPNRAAHQRDLPATRAWVQDGG